MSPIEKRQAMGEAIVQFEKRPPGPAKLQVYKLPAGDGGGAYEIAGINEKYHPKKAAGLKMLIEAGREEEAEREAAAYIEEYTRGVLRFFPSQAAAEDNPALEFVLRDCAFNRGLKGAATVLQIALGLKDIDGTVGPNTKREFAAQLEGDPGPEEVLNRLTDARETYERSSFPWKSGKRDESSKFWKGLSNRWAKCHEVAQARFS
jgi:hypothetical protein